MQTCMMISKLKRFKLGISLSFLADFSPQMMAIRGGAKHSFIQQDSGTLRASCGGGMVLATCSHLSCHIVELGKHQQTRDMPYQFLQLQFLSVCLIVPYPMSLSNVPTNEGHAVSMVGPPPPQLADLHTKIW